MRKGKCFKCQTIQWLERHHIYPQSIFGKEGETVDLCPNCHTDLHVKMGRAKQTEKKFYQDFHRKWMVGLILLIFIFSVIFLNF